MAAIKPVSASLGLAPGAGDAWLTTQDFSKIGAANVRTYVDAHRALVQRGKAISPADAFWAAYPFSVLLVQGQQGASFGQLLAVLLSPLHPVRLAWTYSVTVVARNNPGDSSLMQLAEGWNMPCAGTTVSPTGQLRQLVAVPTDPGQEQDFLSWSALAVISDSNLANLPSVAGGQPLPWGGRTGINAKVVERAIKDYLLVHPHVNAIEVDIRSVNASPRAHEIDEALLELVAAENLREVEQLGGGARIWDSAHRHGEPPTRDRLFAVRGSSEPSRPFEWHSYDVSQPPSDTDLALVENASVHLGVVEGSADGVLGLLPIRRFSPSVLDALCLDQNYAPLASEDVLGLSNLLREIEIPPALQRPALRASPQAQALETISEP
jgi:DNA phosphorothioation-dependent restriction protein DptH